MECETVKILLIEDNLAEVRLIKEAIADAAEAEFNLEHVSELAPGLKRLSEGGISVVLLDLSLPDSRGLETLTSVLAHSPGVPVVVLTGLYDSDLGIKAVREGAQNYLVKSDTNGEEIWREVRFAIERSRTKGEP